MKTPEEKKAQFDALPGREKVECEALADLLNEHLGVDFSYDEVIDLNQDIKWNLESLNEMDGHQFRSSPSVDWHERCKELERELAKANDKISLWSKSYCRQYGGKDADIAPDGIVTVRDWSGLSGDFRETKIAT